MFHSYTKQLDISKIKDRLIAMKKKEKGQYGYINYYKKGKLLVTLILAIMIASIILSMLLAFGDTGRIGIIFAILLVLPFAKFLIAYIMCVKFQTMPQDVYDVVHGQTDETDMIYDLVITQTEGMHYYDAVCVRNGSVYALVLDKHFKEEKKEYETFMQQALANSKYKYIVHLYTDTDAFAKKIHSIGEPNDKTKLIDQYMREQILTFCV